MSKTRGILLIADEREVGHTGAINISPLRDRLRIHRTRAPKSPGLAGSKQKLAKCSAPEP